MFHITQYVRVPAAFMRVFMSCFLDEFEKYCSDVEHTAAWGGQLEVSSRFVTAILFLFPVRLFSNCFFVCLFQLRALTQVLRLPVEVIQASSATIKIGEEFQSEPITLVYVVYTVC